MRQFFGHSIRFVLVNKDFCMKLSQLNPGQKGVIVSFTDAEMAVKLMEMGCLPGEEVEVERCAPLGDPIAIRVAGYQLCLRKTEAAVIIIQ